MSTFIQYIIDFIFPPSDEELKLRSILPAEFPKTVPKSLPTEFPFIYSLFSYKDPLVKELIWQIKYRKNMHAVRIATLALYKQLNAPALLIPIPISKQRRKERGYNQCELIIDEIMKLDIEKKFTKDYDLLIRIKNIEKQTHKNRNERLENTQNIFKVNENLDKNQKIIIVDDVSTTGSTLKEARDCFLQAGYLDIEAITIAH